MLVAAAVLAPVGAQAVSPWSPSLTRAPYLTDLVGTHVNVNWATNQSATTGSLHWGPVTAGTCTLTQTQSATRSSITVGTVHEYQWKTSLALPGQGAYCYRPLLATTDLLGTGASPQFLTQVTPGDTTPFSFDVFGDWGQVDGNGNSIDQSNLFAQIAASGARFAVTVGDNGYPNGNQQNYGDLQQHGQDTSAIFGPSFWTVAGSTIPLFTAAGNHGLSGSTHTDLTTWTEDNAVSSSSGRYQADTYCCVNGTTSSNYASEWYAFDAGPARFYDLDSAWGDSNPGSASVYANDAAAHFAPGTPEYQWLLNDLQSHPTALKFAFSHYPFYADNPNQPSDTSLEGVNGLEGLLGTYGVKIAFNGHTHLYERNTPSAPGMPITYVTGGGGALLEPIGPCRSYDAYGVGWSPSKSKGSACGSAAIPTSIGQVYHFLKVTVSGTTVTVAPTDENGNTFDVQTYTFTNLPDTVIDSAPPASSKLSSAAFTFHATAAGATFACSLDGAPASACTSPASYSSIADGAHSFAVTATTTNGTDPTPAVAQWTVDSSPPTTPANLSASATSATVVSLSWAAASDNVGVAGYNVQRNGVVVGSTTAPTTYVDTTASPSTTYSYAVVARDAAGNVSAPSAPGNVTTPAGSNSPTLVQGAGSSTTTVTLPGTSAAGDLLVLTASVFTGASKPITAVTDGKNTWQKAGVYTFAGQNSDGEIWYAANAAPVQSITVTTTAAVALQVREFNGVAPSSPLDGAAGTAATSTSATSGVATPTPGDLAIGFIAGHANTQAITGLTPGFTIGAQQVTSVIPTVTVVTGFATLPTAAPQGFSGSFANAMYWSAGVAFFKPVSVAPTNDFAITASPVSVTTTAGQSITSSLSTNVTSGNAQTVTFSATGAPAGASVSFTPASLTAGQSSTLSITTTSATPAGTYNIGVTGTGASATHTTTVQLTVNAAPIDDFAVTASPNALTATAGQSALTTIGTSTTSGNAQTVSLTATGAPAGTTLSFTPTSVTSGQSSTLTITTTAATLAGTYSITVTGSGPSLTHTAIVTLAVTVAGSSPHLVQAAGATESAPATSLTAILPAPTTAGDLLVVSASVYAGATNNLVSVSDAAGHLFTKVGAWSSAGHNSDGELWYLPNAASTTSVTVQLNLGASAAIEVQEFAGIAATSPLDVATGTSSTSTTASSGSITPATSGELVVGLVAGHANAEAIAVNSAGFTVQPQQNSTGPIATLESGYMFVTAPSSITFGASFTTVMYWAAGLAAFKAGP